MTIIEREIEKREALIEERDEKAKKAEALKAEAEALELEVANIDVSVLEAEIEELKTYLPKPDIEAEETVTDVETVEAPVSPFAVN